jgi:hypothetical protein
VLAYLEHRDRPTRTGRQVDKDIQTKQKTTPDSYLFIADHVPKEYLKESAPKKPAETDSEYEERKAKEGKKAGPQRKAETEHEYRERLENERIAREEMRRLKPEAIYNLYRTISDNSGQDSASGVYNLIRSHNMRKWFSSTLRKAGCDADLIELFMGHTLGGTKDAYIDLKIDDGIADVKAKYANYIAHLTIQKPLDVSSSPEYRKIEEENKVLVAETVKHMVERDEMAELKKEMRRMQMDMATMMAAATGGGNRTIADDLKLGKPEWQAVEKAIDAVNTSVGMEQEELAQYKGSVHADILKFYKTSDSKPKKKVRP